jgi:hypothetical protein
MVCAPQPSVTRICSPAYRRRMGDLSEDIYSTRKRCLIECDICNVHVQARSLTRHKRFKHGIDINHTNTLLTPPHLTGIGNTYEISMPDYCQPSQYPVLGCKTIINHRYGMRRHFLFLYYYYKIIITEEGELPRCENCGMFCTITAKNCGMFCTITALAGKHRDSVICRNGA